MSRIAFSLLLLTAACAYGAFLSPHESDTLSAISKAGVVIFGLFFLFSMMVGRKIKFDPVLR